MTRKRRRSTHRSAKAERRRRPHFDRADYRRRLRAAGLAADDAPAETPDEIRIALARKIAMALNRWRGCRKRICKRSRGCMAPGGDCGGIRMKPMSRERESRNVARGVRLLRDAFARSAAGQPDGGTQ